MKLNNDELRTRLAAEYVLGTLRGPARRRFAAMLRIDASLANIVKRWEAHLTPLAGHIGPVEPPARVWQNIQRQITPAANPRQHWKNSLYFWRTLSLGMGGLTTVLLVSLSIFIAQPKESMMTAVLAHDGLARLVVEQPKHGLLMVKMVNPWTSMKDHSLELWVIHPDGKPHSLGVIHEHGETKISMNKLDDMLADGMTFALSLEPMGGSPTGLPSGEVLCSGPIAHRQVPQKTPLI